MNETFQRVCAVVTNEPLEQQSHTRDISVELVDKCIRNLKSGKACGIDDIGAEHLLYAHPSVVVHLKLLFAMCMSHGYVPHAFGQVIIIPLVKDKSAALNNVNNYRAITLIPVISKVFEGVILSHCEDALITSDLQFGFRKGAGCSKAIFSSRAVVSHYVNNASNV